MAPRRWCGSMSGGLENGSDRGRTTDLRTLPAELADPSFTSDHEEELKQCGDAAFEPLAELMGTAPACAGMKGSGLHSFPEWRMLFALASTRGLR